MRIIIGPWVLLFFLILSSCEAPKTKEEKGTVGIENTDEVSISKTEDTDEPDNNTVESRQACPDTAKLKSLGIEYKKLPQARYKSYDETWVISYRDTTFQSDQIKEASYTYLLDIKSSSERDCSLFILDQIEIEFRESGLRETFGVGGDAVIRGEEKLIKPDVVLSDFNFDGFLDINFGLDLGGSGGEIRTYVIYDESRKRFGKALNLSSVSQDFERKLIRSSWKAGHAGRLGTVKWEKFNDNDSLILVESISSDLHDTLDVYIIEIVFLDSLKQKYHTEYDTIPIASIHDGEYNIHEPRYLPK